MTAPAYLAEPDMDRRTYGSLAYDKGYYVVEGEPAVLEMAKRLFPGCSFTGGRHSGRIRFRATRRAVGDLNWLMLRFPLEIEDVDQFERDRGEAIAHAERRERNQAIGPTTPPATFAGELMPYQAEAVSFLLANQRAMCADDMGLGKTITALATLASAQAFPALLVVPTSVQLQWQRQAGAFLDLPAGELFNDPEGTSICHVIKGLRPYALPERSLYVIHYGLLRGWWEALREIGFKAVVFDEIQELRHTGTAKCSAASMLAGDADLVFGLSGTPIYNYGGEIWSIVNILDYQCLGDWESFSREWCTGYGEKIVAQPDLLHDYLKREGLMIRRRKADVQSQLPPKRRAVHTIDHDERTYDRMIADAAKLAARYDQIKGWRERGEAALEIDQQSRLASGVSKAPYVADFVETLLQAGERPLVYAWHHDVHDLIGYRIEQAGWRIRRITGKQTQAQKNDAVQAFANEQAEMVQLSLRATAGLDGLQGMATCVVFAELDWSPAVHSQCEDRLHRIGVGELESVLCYYLVSRTGTDGVMMESLGLKIGQFVGVMGDQAETEEERELAQQATKEHMKQIIERLKERGTAA